MELTHEVGRQERQAEPSLQAACARFNELFNQRDAKQVASCWTEDGTLITPTGEVGNGRSGVETAYRHDCDTVLKGTTSRFEITSVRRLGRSSRSSTSSTCSRTSGYPTAPPRR